MPVYDATTEEKIALLRQMRRAGMGIEVYDVIGAEWPEPDGTIYYSVIDIPNLPVSPLEVRLIPDSDPNWFIPVASGATVGDEEVDLQMWNADEVIDQLLIDHGEGIKLKLYWWFPQAELMFEHWYGHLRFEDEAAVDIIKLKAVQGFRSSESLVPGRAHYQNCSAVFGGLLDTQDEIDEHDCPYNLHIGGSIGNVDPSTSDPWTYCDRRTQQSCIARGVDPQFHLSHRTISGVRVNNQTQGPNLLITSKGNETNLKEPVRVVMGRRRIHAMPVMAYSRATNTNNPDQGFFLALYEGCEGPIRSFSGVQVAVNNSTQNVSGGNVLHYNYRLGTRGQTSAGSDLSTHGYSGTAHIRYNFGRLNPADVGPSNASASAIVDGLDNVRVYTDADTYTEIWTANRVWHLARILCDKRWGYGYDYKRLNIDSFIAAAEWCDERVRFTDPFGKNWDHTRSESHVELIGKKVQQQIDDICIAGRISRPFLFGGKIHVVPLSALTEDELAACPVFTDEGPTRNIIWEGDEGEAKSTLTVSRKSDYELINRIECTIDDAAEDWLETPLRPVEDNDAQLAAGRVAGDTTRKVNSQKYSLLGVTNEAQGIKMQWSLIDLGPSDEGGLQNNLSPKFKIWFTEALDLYPHKVIKIESSRLTKYGFEYFRIRPDGINRLDDLSYEITAQAYNVEYMDTFETVIEDPPDDACPDGFHWDPILLMCVRDTIYDPCLPLFGTITHQNGVMNIPIEPC